MNNDQTRDGTWKRQEASGFFIASNFQIEPDDVIYAPRSSAAEARKFFEFVQSISRVVYDVSSKPPATIEWE